MDIFKAIEKANYLATADDVQKLASNYMDSQQTVLRTQNCYFRILLARTQTAICGKPTLRAREKVHSLTPEEITVHLDVFEKQHSELYAVVLKAVVTPDIDARTGLSTDETNRRTLERNRRSNFARSAASTLRKYIRRGGNVLRINVTQATKAHVAEATPLPDGSEPEDRAQRAVKRAALRIVSLVQTMAEDDKQAAMDTLRTAMSTVADSIITLGLKSTTRPAVAMHEQRLLKTPSGVFWPATVAQQ